MTETRESKIDSQIKAIRAGGLDRLAKKLRSAIEPWMTKHGLVADYLSGVTYETWLDHFDRPMGGGIGMVITAEYNVLHALETRLQSEWYDYLGSMGYIYEMHNDATMVLWAIMDKRLETEILKAFEFEWCCRLVSPDYDEIYGRIYEYFAANPGRMGDLHWRKFEELLSSVFTAHGYTTILGPGRADEGVDIRLVNNGIFGDQITVVQVKRYKKPITLEQVAALSGVMYDQRASSGLFVTTSRYLPSAQKFAARQARRIELATSADVALWCDAISSRKSANPHIVSTILASDLNPDKVVYARGGYTMIYYDFAYIVAESPTAVRLAKLPRTEIPLYEYNNGRRYDTHTGKMIPDLTQGLGPNADIITARAVLDGHFPITDDNMYWRADDGQLYFRWNRQPLLYDYND